MITHRSLQNQMLCLRELRDMIHRLPSLRWQKNAQIRYSRSFENDFALVKLLEDINSFLHCKYANDMDTPNSEVGEKVAALISANKNLIGAFRNAQNTGKQISTKDIKPVTSAMTSLYRDVKFLPKEPVCSTHWQRLGLITSAGF